MLSTNGFKLFWPNHTGSQHIKVKSKNVAKLFTWQYNANTKPIKTMKQNIDNFAIDNKNAIKY